MQQPDPSSLKRNRKAVVSYRLLVMFSGTSFREMGLHGNFAGEYISPMAVAHIVSQTRLLKGGMLAPYTSHLPADLLDPLVKYVIFGCIFRLN